MQALAVSSDDSVQCALRRFKSELWTDWNFLTKAELKLHLPFRWNVVSFYL